MVYKGLSEQKNQGMFIVSFFVAAGCSWYYLPEKGKKLLNSELEGPRHYIKDRPLGDIKSSFPRPINKKKAAEYLLTYFNESKVRFIMDCFGIHSDVKENNRALAYAIVEQFNAFIESECEDLECIVSSAFYNYSSMTDEELNKAINQPGRLINGDNVYLASYRNTSEHIVNCYEKFTHVWEIENSGKTLWSGRKLVFVNQDKIKPQAMANVINIPETKPNTSAKLEVEFNASGFEGKYEAKWEMQDSENQNCFPTMSHIFNFTIITQFNDKMDETK